MQVWGYTPDRNGWDRTIDNAGYESAALPTELRSKNATRC